MENYITLMKQAKILLKDAQLAQREERHCLKELNSLVGSRLDPSADLFSVTIEGLMEQRGVEILKQLEAMEAA